MPASLFDKFFDKFLNPNTTYSNGIVWPADIDANLKLKIIKSIQADPETNASYEEHIQNILTLNHERDPIVVANTYNTYRSPWKDKELLYKQK